MFHERYKRTLTEIDEPGYRPQWGFGNWGDVGRERESLQLSEAEKLCFDLVHSKVFVGDILKTEKESRGEIRNSRLDFDQVLYHSIITPPIGVMAGAITYATIFNLALGDAQKQTVQAFLGGHFGHLVLGVGALMGFGIAVQGLWASRFENVLSSRLSGQIALAKQAGTNWTEALCRVGIAREYLLTEASKVSHGRHDEGDTYPGYWRKELGKQVVDFDCETRGIFKKIFNELRENPESAKKHFMKEFNDLKIKGERELAELSPVWDNFQPLSNGKSVENNLCLDLARLSNTFRLLLLGIFMRDRVDPGAQAEIDQTLMEHVNRLDPNRSLTTRVMWRCYPVQRAISKLSEAAVILGSVGTITAITGAVAALA